MKNILINYFDFQDMILNFFERNDFIKLDYKEDLRFYVFSVQNDFL